MNSGTHLFDLSIEYQRISEDEKFCGIQIGNSGIEYHNHRKMYGIQIKKRELSTTIIGRGMAFILFSDL